jgi:leucyl/phenylalanyl-tRNA---protein transferase
MRAVFQDFAPRSARQIPKAAARPLAIALLRGVFLVVDPVTVGWWAARLAKQPDQAAAEIARRVSSFIPPTAAEVVANYARGLLLGGRAASCETTFEWVMRPMRAVITRETAKVPKRLRTIQRHGELDVRYGQDFEAIIRHCQDGRAGWLTPALIDVYREVDNLGFVATVGTYRDGQLVGGLWGIGIGRVLGIMSMFHLENHAGALALAALADVVSADGRWAVIDCVDLNPNFERYGASEIPVRQFSDLVWSSL